MIKHSESRSYFIARLLNRTGKTILTLAAMLALAGSVRGAAIADFGTTAPTPGANDISQLVNNGDSARDGLNYFADNSSPPGQTFTTGSNPSGYALTSLYVQTGGYNANNTGTAQTYTLRIYSISSGTATLISTYVTDNLLGFTDGDWLKYTGMTNILQPNTVYAYTHARNTVGWDGMACATGNLYAGGQICLIPTTGGSVVYGSTGNSDAAFLANLAPVTDPFVFPTYIKTPSAIGGNSVVVSAGIGSGTQPIYYQWLFTGTNGVATKIPGANSISYTITSVQTTNAGTYSLMVSNNPGGVPKVITNTPALLAVRAAYTISTIGTTAPTPGTYDIAQSSTGTDLDGLNYFSDNNPPPGQTFTTSNNPAGYTLTAIYLKTAGNNSSGTGTQQTYTLRLFLISGSTATLISTYLSDNTVGFTDGDWLSYTGMTNTLQPNTIYAYTHSRNGPGWDELSAVDDASLYTGGQACLIPVNGGAITYSTDNALEASFDVSMVPKGFPAIQNVTIATGNSPGGNALSVYVPAPVTLAVQAAGTTPLHYDWQTDGGLGGAFSDLPSSNTNSYAINTTSMAAGTYLYQVIVTNVNSMATSSVVQLNLSAASAPIMVTDTAINPAATFAGSSVAVSAAFNGSPTIIYQWMFNNGSGAVAIAGATNATYSIASAQLTNGGSYYLTASNGISPFMLSSTPVSLLVGLTAQNNSASASMQDAGSSAPSPGTYDISQLVTTVPTTVADLNYYTDDYTPPGQTFTTLGAATNGYLLSSIYIQDELSTFGGDATNPVVYTLGIYSVAGSNAVLLTAYNSTNLPYITNQPAADPSAIVDGDWIRWTGLTNVLKTNSTYAFSIQKTAGHGWWKLGNDYGSGDLYSGGQAVSLPGSGIGAMIFSSDTTLDAGFLVALSPAIVVVTPPHIGTAKVLGGNFVLSGSDGTPGTGYSVLSQTNVAKPLATWTVAGTGTFNGSGNFSFTNAVTPGTSKLFYRIRVP
jgi:hypothetical protein